MVAMETKVEPAKRPRKEPLVVVETTLISKEDLVAPFLLYFPFRLMDWIYSGGRVSRAFEIEKLLHPTTPPRAATDNPDLFA